MRSSKVLSVNAICTCIGNASVLKFQGFSYCVKETEKHVISYFFERDKKEFNDMQATSFIQNNPNVNTFVQIYYYYNKWNDVVFTPHFTTNLSNK